MSLDQVIKVEITAHIAVMEELLEKLQELSLLQIDPHSIKRWESEQKQIEETTLRLADMKSELADTGRALDFLERFETKVPLLKKLAAGPLVFSRHELRNVTKDKDVQRIREQALHIFNELNDLDSAVRDLTEKKRQLLPLESLNIPLDLVAQGGKAEVVLSRLPKEDFDSLVSVDASEYIGIERIGGEDPVYFSIVFHGEARDQIEQLQKDFRFEPLSLPSVSKTPAAMIDDYSHRIEELHQQRDRLFTEAKALAVDTGILRYAYDLLETETEKESVKEKFFYTQKVFIIDGWIRERDYPRLKEGVSSYTEAAVERIDKEEEELPPVAYKNNALVSPYELIVNLYSPPNPNELDPTPFLMPFYTLFFGICLTDAGYGLITAIISFLGLSLLKPRNGMRKFLKLFFILGISTFVVGALIGTVFGINFDMLPERLAWLREARHKIMIFDSSRDVLTFFIICLGIGVVHLIVGYLLKIAMLIKSGEWAEAVCDHLPWVFLLLSPIPIVLIRFMPDMESQLRIVFFVILALWAGIIVLFSERTSFNPIKRIGKGLFTIYGATSVLGDVLSYSRLLALGLATGVIGGVMNTLAGMVKQLPIIGIAGSVLVLIVGHLFNLFISGLSAFVHSIRLQFMEFFTKFYTGEGELLTTFTEKRRYTCMKTAKD